jgi:hypothetical protein
VRSPHQECRIVLLALTISRADHDDDNNNNNNNNNEAEDERLR